MNQRGLTRFFRWRSKGHDRRGWRCPDELQLAAYTDHRLTSGEKEQVEAHLADCDFCLRQVAFLARIQGAELLETVPGPLPSRARGLAVPQARPTLSGVWRWQALAAAAACLVIVTAVSLRHPQGPVSSSPSPTREASPPRVPAQTAAPAETPPAVPRTVRKVPTGLSAPVVVFPRDGATISRKAGEFRWEPVQGSLYYEVRVVDAEGNVVWEQRAESNTLSLPGEVNLKAGRKYFVWVRAALAGGRVVRSRAVGFTLADHN